jgi:hypothetical protein
MKKKNSYCRKIMGSGSSELVNGTIARDEIGQISFELLTNGFYLAIWVLLYETF